MSSMGMRHHLESSLAECPASAPVGCSRRLVESRSRKLVIEEVHGAWDEVLKEALGSATKLDRFVPKTPASETCSTLDHSHLHNFALYVYPE